MSKYLSVTIFTCIFLLLLVGIIHAKQQEKIYALPSLPISHQPVSDQEPSILDHDNQDDDYSEGIVPKTWWQKYRTILMSIGIPALAVSITLGSYLLYQHYHASTYKDENEEGGNLYKEHSIDKKKNLIADDTTGTDYAHSAPHYTQHKHYYVKTDNSQEPLPLVTSEPKDFASTSSPVFGLANKNKDQIFVCYQEGTTNTDQKIHVVKRSFGGTSLNKGMVYWEKYKTKDANGTQWLTTYYGKPLLPIHERGITVSDNNGKKFLLYLADGCTDFDAIKTIKARIDNEDIILVYGEEDQSAYLLMPPVSQKEHSDKEPYIPPVWNEHISIGVDGNNFFYLDKEKTDTTPIPLQSRHTLPYIEIFDQVKNNYPRIFLSTPAGYSPTGEPVYFAVSSRQDTSKKHNHKREHYVLRTRALQQPFLRKIWENNFLLEKVETKK